MDGWITIWSSVSSVLLTLIVTTLFNKFIGLPKKWKQEKEAEDKYKEKIMEENRIRDQRLDHVEEAVNALPGYRKQSLKIQDELKCTDERIINLCEQINQSVIENRREVVERLKRLESREKNALRAKILEEYRLYTDKAKNPKRAWSEMEEHSFFELVKDYEELGGNDYVHSVVIPAMHELRVIFMHDIAALEELYHSRTI